MIPAVKHVMKPEEFRLLREFVEETFGLVLDGTKGSYLGPRLWERVQELRLSSFAEYYSYLKFAPCGGAERQKLISHITNNETYFFREEAQLKVFADEVLNALWEKKQKNRDRKIRILSAGCSTGEEVYTLAMLLHESGKFAWDWDVKIIGIDIDPQALAAAEKGVYSGRAFQTTQNSFLERYFIRCNNGYEVRESLRRITSFMPGNLLEFEKAVEDQGVDLIFCRNVLIYFNDETVKRVIESFARVLSREGLLFLGHSESLSRISSRYQPIRFPGAIIYRVRDGE
jgi:chemotaxis protein methyltransferase CheR